MVMRCSKFEVLEIVPCVLSLLKRRRSLSFPDEFCMLWYDDDEILVIRIGYQKKKLRELGYRWDKIKTKYKSRE